jgi:hypothetical protein
MNEKEANQFDYTGSMLGVSAEWIRVTIDNDFC